MNTSLTGPMRMLIAACERLDAEAKPFAVLDEDAEQANAEHWDRMRKALKRAKQVCDPAKEISRMCECGDFFPHLSWEAGYIDAVGMCSACHAVERSATTSAGPVSSEAVAEFTGKFSTHIGGDTIIGCRMFGPIPRPGAKLYLHPQIPTEQKGEA